MSTTINVIGLNTFEPPAGAVPTGYGDGMFKVGFTNDVILYKSGTENRVAVPENYGYYIYSLNNPESPNAIGYQDLRPIPGFEQFGDGFSMVSAIAISPDGAHALLGYRNAKSNISLKPSGNIFSIAGCFGQGGAAQIIQKQGSRYLGYSVASSLGGLVVADITTFLTGSQATTAGSINHETVTGTPPGINLMSVGDYILYHNGIKLVIVNATTIGTYPNLSTGFVVNTYLPEIFGFPANSYISSIAANIHPVTNRLNVAIECYGPTSNSLGIALAQTSDGINFTNVGSIYQAPDPWSGINSFVAAKSLTIAATSTDLLVFNWAHQSAPDRYKLISLSASEWGTDLTPSYIVSNFPGFATVKSLVVGSSVYIYSAHSQNASVVHLSVNTVVTTTPPGPPSNLQAVAGNGQVVLSWALPSVSGGLAITGYTAKNTNTAGLVTTTGLTTTFTGLQNGTIYTFQVTASNGAGESLPAQISSTPNIATTRPGQVENLHATVGNGTVTVGWLPPVSDGGASLLSYTITNRATSEVFSLATTVLSKTFSGLTNSTPYTFAVYATNIAGSGQEITVTGTPVSTSTAPLAPQIGIITTTIDSLTLNWSAPLSDGGSPITSYNLILERVVPQGLESAYIVAATERAFTVGALNQGQIYRFRINAVNLIGISPNAFSDPMAVNTPSNTNPTIQLVTQNYSYNHFTIAPVELNRASTNYLKFLYPNEVTETVTTLTGTETVYLVKNHVPTSDYDSKNAKALVESQVIKQVRSLDISNKKNFETLVPKNNNKYTLKLDYQYIRPNSVTIQYYDSTNNLITLRDYLGDGDLLIRVKTVNPNDDTITFVYPKDKITNSSFYGKIDYNKGVINQLIFPNIKPYKIVSNGVKFPIQLTTTTIGAVDRIAQTSSWIYFYVNGIKYDFALDVTDPDKYYSGIEIANLLNGMTSFANRGLVAGISGQNLYIEYVGINRNIGPFDTLSLNNNEHNLNTQNYKMFGIQPIQNPSSIIYLSYSYSPDIPNKYKHIWYPTPHFTLISKSVQSAFTTKGHLDYLMERLDDIRPINTILEPITFATSLEESNTIKDAFNVSSGQNVTFPFIKVKVPAVSSLVPLKADIKLINPDKQEVTFPNSFNWVVP